VNSPIHASTRIGHFGIGKLALFKLGGPIETCKAVLKLETKTQGLSVIPAAAHLTPRCGWAAGSAFKHILEQDYAAQVQKGSDTPFPQPRSILSRPRGTRD
jgi:hypothetical protein